MGSVRRTTKQLVKLYDDWECGAPVACESCDEQAVSLWQAKDGPHPVCSVHRDLKKSGIT